MGSFQLRAVGYECVGYEISKPRAAFAEGQFGVRTLSEASDLDRCVTEFDVIFASHVLEHLPCLQGVFERFSSLLRPDARVRAELRWCRSAQAGGGLGSNVLRETYHCV